MTGVNYDGAPGLRIYPTQEAIGSGGSLPNPSDTAQDQWDQWETSPGRMAQVIIFNLSSVASKIAASIPAGHRVRQSSGRTRDVTKKMIREAIADHLQHHLDSYSTEPDNQRRSLYTRGRSCEKACSHSCQHVHRTAYPCCEVYGSKCEHAGGIALVAGLASIDAMCANLTDKQSRGTLTPEESIALAFVNLIKTLPAGCNGYYHGRDFESAIAGLPEGFSNSVDSPVRTAMRESAPHIEDKSVAEQMVKESRDMDKSDLELTELYCHVLLGDDAFADD